MIELPRRVSAQEAHDASIAIHQLIEKADAGKTVTLVVQDGWNVRWLVAEKSEDG